MAELTHLDEAGAARMVDVGGKAVTTRIAVAAGRISMTKDAARAIAEGAVAKGDVLAVARVAGIMAAKRTAELIPLCHPLPLTRAAIDLVTDVAGVTVTATCATEGRTGVEMEALTAASVALLTIHDMAKAIDKAMVIDGVRLVSKTGGKSGDWQAPPTLTAEPQLFVTDLTRALAFYTGPLGFATAFVHGEPPFYAQVTRGGARLNLRVVDAPVIATGTRDREPHLLAATLTLDEAEPLYRAFEAAGVPFHQLLRDEPWGASTFIVVDPDGNLIGFAGKSAA